MTRAKEIVEATCVCANLIYANYESGAYGIRSRMPYDPALIEEFRLKRDLISHNIITYMPEPNYSFVQVSQDIVWTIVHSLDYDPKVLVVDCQNKKLEPTVTYVVPKNTLILTFTIPTSGKAFLT